MARIRIIGHGPEDIEGTAVITTDPRLFVPVGYLVRTSNPTNPAMVLGYGTWVLVGTEEY